MLCQYDAAIAASYKHQEDRAVRKHLIPATVIVLFAILISWQYRYHLLWKVYVIRGGASAPVVQVKNMAPGDMRKDWLEHSGTCTAFDLPAESVKLQNIPSNAFQLFESDQWEIVFADFDDFGTGPLIDLATMHFAEVPPMTIPRMRLAVYEANTRGFNWSMSAAEARQHLFCMTAAPLMNLAIDGHVEWHSNELVDVLIEFSASRTTIFWQFSRKLCGGSMDILPKQTVENEFARGVCRSLRSKIPNGE